MATPKETARKARTLANKVNLTKHQSRSIVKADAKLNKKKLTAVQEEKAVNAMQTRRMNDRNKTAARAEFIARREDPKNKEAKMKRAVREGNIKFEKIKNAAENPKKPLTASERAFVKNQKEKAKATKRTGVYPNTAN